MTYFQTLFCFSDFLPGAGPLLHLTTPQSTDTIRVETGVRQGMWRISGFFLLIVKCAKLLHFPLHYPTTPIQEARVCTISFINIICVAIRAWTFDHMLSHLSPGLSAYLFNTPTNLCMALFNFLLFCFVLYCYAFVQYCYLKSIQYNAVHKFVGVLDSLPSLYAVISLTRQET